MNVFNLFRRPTRPASRRPSSRLALEALEGRAVPATLGGLPTSPDEPMFLRTVDSEPAAVGMLLPAVQQSLGFAADAEESAALGKTGRHIIYSLTDEARSGQVPLQDLHVLDDREPTALLLPAVQKVREAAGRMPRSATATAETQDDGDDLSLAAETEEAALKQAVLYARKAGGRSSIN